MIAARIREFFATLFGSRRIEDLKQALAKTEKERDYFRARADRLELMLLQGPKVPAPAERRPAGSPTNLPVGRKFWPQVVADWNAQQKIEAEQEASNRHAAAALATLVDEAKKGH